MIASVAPFGAVKGHWDAKASSGTSYAWFVWCKRWAEAGPPHVILIPPAAKALGTKPDDAARFGRSA
jgi:hypothetical protein